MLDVAADVERVLLMECDAWGTGWWKLSYSSHKLLLALIRTTNLYQKITMEKGSVKISECLRAMPESKTRLMFWLY